MGGVFRRIGCCFRAGCEPDASVAVAVMFLMELTAMVCSETCGSADGCFRSNRTVSDETADGSGGSSSTAAFCSDAGHFSLTCRTRSRPPRKSRCDKFPRLFAVCREACETHWLNCLSRFRYSDINRHENAQKFDSHPYVCYIIGEPDVPISIRRC